MQFGSRVAHGAHRSGDLSSTVAGSRENENSALVGIKEVAQELVLLILFDHVKLLVDQFGWRALASDFHSDRIDQVAIRHVGHFRGHRCRKQHRLSVLGSLIQDSTNDGGKAHIEHSVRFI